MESRGFKAMGAQRGGCGGNVPGEVPVSGGSSSVCAVGRIAVTAVMVAMAGDTMSTDLSVVNVRNREAARNVFDSSKPGQE